VGWADKSKLRQSPYFSSRLARGRRELGWKVQRPELEKVGVLNPVALTVNTLVCSSKTPNGSLPLSCDVILHLPEQKSGYGHRRCESAIIAKHLPRRSPSTDIPFHCGSTMMMFLLSVPGRSKNGSISGRGGNGHAQAAA
jgi:hypothetical protein